MAGYTLISDNKLGMNIFIKEDKASKYIMFKGEDKAKEEKLYLKGRPIIF
jgi:CTP:phosphocholine cytidylyltransferase-like protein